VRYLSPEWLAAAAEAIAHDATLHEAAVGVRLTMEQTVADGPQGTIRWHIVFDDGDVELVPGPAPHAHLHFTTSWDVAAAIARGEQAAPAAFIEGRLRVGGDLGALLRHQRRLAAVDDALATLRSKTVWE
jgi:predicted lipid carrier protein YhbT